MLTVSDEGCGIADAEKEKVFEKFYRAGNKGSQPTKGTGIGLFLVKRIVSGHHGKLFVRDNHPNGSVFTIEFNQV
jgi:two-component system sensor histidine kinase CiaH